MSIEAKGNPEFGAAPYESDKSPVGEYVPDHSNHGPVAADVRELQRGLSGFHTSMIAIGGAIGAGLFVSAGGAFSQGGPASVLIGFIIIGLMML